MKALLLFLIISTCFSFSFSAFKFTKIICEGLDDSLGKFEYCRMKAVKRDENYVELKARLYRDLNNITLHYQFMKRLNGWKPFLYNMKIDLCQFLNHRNNPVINLYLDSVKTHLNMKKIQCPFKDPVVLSNVSSTEMSDLLSKLPFQNGEYAEYTTWLVNNVPKAKINSYFLL